MCDVPSTAVCCSESIEYFPSIASRFLLKLFFTIPVDLIITDIIVHFRLLLLLLLLSSPLSPLCRVFIHIFLRQTMFLRNTMLQLFCRYCLWCPLLLLLTSIHMLDPRRTRDWFPFDMIGLYVMIYDIFNCSWVDTRWQ
jgi:hypothetical protein